MTNDTSSSSTLSDIEQSTFKTIRTFITDLAEIFSSSHHELKLYERLIEKTTLKHEIAIRRHIESFRSFCVANRKSIIERSHKALTGNIVYSDKVFIDIKSILDNADDDTRKVIWLHILKICAFVDPSTKAREILKENASNESNLINEIMTKVEETVDLNTTNPMEAVTTIMNSGIFNDLMTGMNTKLQDGSIDLSKLMGTVESLCSNIKGGEGGLAGVGGGEIFKLIQQIVPMAPPPPPTKNMLH